MKECAVFLMLYSYSLSRNRIFATLNC